MNSYELLPCPFCGASAELLIPDISDKSECWIHCEKECVEQSHFTDEETAIKNWNKRAPIIYNDQCKKEFERKLP